MNDWDDLIPKWRKEGRTGPGPLAPKYAKRKDRATVRRGGEVAKNPNPYGGGNANPGGPGGYRGKIRPTGGGGGTPPKKKCCPMVAAVVSVKNGNWNQARRYARLAVRSVAARLA